MRVFTAIFVTSAIVFAASASPVPQVEVEQSSGSPTFNALREWFSPVSNYFRETFPEQSPSDIADDVREAASDAQKWAQENVHIQTVSEAVKPYWQSAQDTANNLSQKTFSEMFDDIRTGVKSLDERIGGAINEWNQES
ncbi:unnamed protein product [Meganyctiphanes norvegica]|uniref:Uncharacterized protein n=1 Tax=Meganyctiphanes norvegica TaxID=48144 RepID=A0AAV2S4M0_MEGNR